MKRRKTSPTRGRWVGRQIIAGMRAAGTARWEGGRIYDPEDGRHYDASITLKSPDNLLVEGCVLFVCKSQVWRQRRPDPCGAPPAPPPLPAPPH
ncbi:MAG TPA: DUF2147 domain-containing protein [Burkholderiaceae bacterium]|nr:DUF2147 domain-containing protein [Burkholderiaceae bacterium]